VKVDIPIGIRYFDPGATGFREEGVTGVAGVQELQNSEAAYFGGKT
jgi:hypothetical protein